MKSWFYFFIQVLFATGKHFTTFYFHRFEEWIRVENANLKTMVMVKLSEIVKSVQIKWRLREMHSSKSDFEALHK